MKSSVGIVGILGVLSLVGVVYLGTQVSSSKEADWAEKSARAKKIFEIQEKAIDEKKEEIKEKEKELKNVSEQVKAALQGKVKSEEEKEALQQALVKIKEATVRKLREQKDKLEKEHRLFLARAKNYTKKQLVEYENKLKQAQVESERIKKALQSKKGLVVELCTGGQKTCQNPKKYQLPEQMSDFLEAKKKIAQANLDAAKKKYEILKNKLEKDPTNKELEEEVAHAKKAVEGAQQSLEEIVALAAAAGLLGGPIAAAIVAVMGILGGFGKGKSGSGADYGASSTSVDEKQKSKKRKKRKKKSAAFSPPQKGKRPAGGNIGGRRAASSRFLQTKGNQLFLGSMLLGPASSGVVKAVGKQTKIRKILRTGRGSKYLIKHGKYCNEVYSSGSIWKLSAAQSCNAR